MKLASLLIIAKLMIYPSVAFSDDIGGFANKLFNHYEYDDKINNYLKSFFSFESKKNNKSSKTHHGLSKSSTKISKSSFKIKSKNKAVFSFGNGQSLQINPTNIDSQIIYNTTPFSYFNISKDTIYYGIKLDF
jgi:hypothetical protein